MSVKWLLTGLALLPLLSTDSIIKAPSRGLPPHMPKANVKASPNINYLFGALTSDKITKMSGGRIPKMTKEQASGLIGSWIIETGSPTLSNLDVTEKGAGAGRGLSQYTGPRRVAYDRAASVAKAQGIDTNSPQFQLRYFAQEYAGQHDPAPGKSLSGWTRVFENAPAKGSAADFAQYYTGSADSGSGYFRPSVPHTESRADAAGQIMRLYGAAKPQQITTVTPVKPSNPGLGSSSATQKGGLNFFGLQIPKLF